MHKHARVAVALAAAGVALSTGHRAFAGVMYFGGGTATPSTTVDAFVGGTAPVSPANWGTWSTANSNWNASLTSASGYAAWSNSALDTAAFVTRWTTSAPAISLDTAGITTNGVLVRLEEGVSNSFTGLASAGSGSATLTLDAPSGAPQIRMVSNQSSTSFYLGSHQNWQSGKGAVILAGTKGFTLNPTNSAVNGSNMGLGKISVGSASTISGDATIVGGTLALANQYGNATGNGTLANINTFRASGNFSNFIVYEGTGGSDLNRIGDSATVALSGGRFEYHGTNAAATASAETIGTLKLDGGGTMVVTASGTGLNSTLTIGTIDRGASGKGTLALKGNGLNAANGVTVAVDDFAANTFLPWAFHGNNGSTNTVSGRFVKADATGTKLEAVSGTAGDVNLSNWASAGYSNSSDVQFDSNPAFTGTMSGAVEMRSLAFTFYSGSSQTLNLGGNQLKLQAIGFAHDGYSSTLTLNNGTITSPGTDLYIHTLPNNSSQAGVFALGAKVTGTNVNLIKSGEGTLALNTANDYTGNTYINQGRVTIGATNAIPTASNVTVTGASIEAGDQQQTYSGVVTLVDGNFAQNGGLLRFNNAGAGLVFNGGNINKTHTNGTLEILTNVKYESTAYRQATFTSIQGEDIQLATSAGSFTREFDIADSTSLAAGVSEMLIQMPLKETTGSAKLVKKGTGTLEIDAAATYTGGTDILEGTIKLSQRIGTAQSGLTANRVATNSRVLAFDAPISGVVPGQTITGTGIAAGTRVVAVLSAYDVLLSGSPSASGNTSDIAFQSFTSVGSLGSGPITIAPGAKLDVTALTSGFSYSAKIAGAGTIDATGTTITAAAGVAPGGSPGVLTVLGNLVLAGDSSFEITGTTRATEYDGLDVSGQLTYGGTLDISFSGEASNFDYDLFNLTAAAGQFSTITLSGYYTGTLTRDLAAAGQGLWTGSVSGSTFQFSESTGNLAVAVPEPTITFMAAGVGLMALARRQRRA